MKISNHLHLFLSFFLITGFAYSQTGWIQTQFNPGIGYNLTTTDSMIYASTYDGVFLTSNYGMSWISKGPKNHAVYDVIQTDQTLLAATADGIFRSTDNGNTWELATSSIICSGVGGTQGNGVFARNGSYLFIRSRAFGLFRSGDSGKTWQLLSTGTQPPFNGDLGEWASSIYSFKDKIFMNAPGGDIGIYYSSDNGNSWNKGKSNFPLENNEFLFFHAHQDTIYSGGFMGLYRSTDHGINWIPQYRNSINSEGQLTGIGTFRDLISFQNKIIAAIDFKSIQISEDGGKSWSDFNSGLISDWTFADLEIKPPHIWALSGFFGNAYRRSLTEITTSLNPELKTENNSFILEQNFPNPVKHSTAIRYTIKNTDNITLSIFDIHGKEVLKLVDETLFPGIYETEINSNQLINGTYFLRMNSNKTSQTRKFTVLKNR